MTTTMASQLNYWIVAKKKVRPKAETSEQPNGKRTINVSNNLWTLCAFICSKFVLIYFLRAMPCCDQSIWFHFRGPHVRTCRFRRCVGTTHLQQTQHNDHNRQRNIKLIYDRRKNVEKNKIEIRWNPFADMKTKQNETKKKELFCPAKQRNQPERNNKY